MGGREFSPRGPEFSLELGLAHQLRHQRGRQHVTGLDIARFL
jgi:hypothetical protein